MAVCLTGLALSMEHLEDRFGAASGVRWESHQVDAFGALCREAEVAAEAEAEAEGSGGAQSLWGPEPDLRNQLILIKHAAAGVGPECRSRWATATLISLTPIEWLRFHA